MSSEKASYFPKGETIMSRRNVLLVGEAVLLAAACLLALPEAQAQDARGYRYPWYEKGYRGYNEPPEATRPTNPAAAPVAPTKYTVVITMLPDNMEGGGNVATMMAHVPDNAQVYFGDHLTRSTGTERTYVSPPLDPRKAYTYTVRVDWVEEGTRVTQTHEFDVRPGMMHCFYLVKSGSTIGDDATVEANLAKLDPEDRKLAEAQKLCAVQEQVRLGAVGKPVKVMINGQPVFLCCETCVSRAQNNPEQTLEQVKKNKAKKAPSSSP
jgi:uncharacterized protein (TIGR03000 family)